MRNKGKLFGAGRTGQVRLSPRDYRRDKDFAGFLAKELDMEAAPAAYHKALRRAYAELPRDMPVRHYPLRAALKSLATVAVLMLVLGASLLGVNQAYPQLTENLPGLGMVFKAINGTTGDDLPAPPPLAKTGTGTSRDKARQAHAMPAFDPVELQDHQGLGALTVDNAWTDGRQVFLDVSLWVPADTLAALLSGQTEEDGLPSAIEFSQGQDYDGATADASPSPPAANGSLDSLSGPAQVQVNGRSPISIQSITPQGGHYIHGYPDCLALVQQDSQERDTGDGKTEICAHYTATWVLGVPIQPSSGRDISVTLDLSSAWASYPSPRYFETELPLIFTGDLEVEIDTSSAITIESPAEDNHYTLENVSCTPGQFSASIQVPHSGYYGYSLLPLSYASAPPRYKPYGMYAVLADKDGTVLAQTLWDGTDPQPDSSGEESIYPLDFSALMKPLDREKLVLTLYQFDPEDLESWESYWGQAPGETAFNPVMAQFTIDLTEATAAPSTAYQEAGLTKLSVEDCLKGPHHPDFENGLYVQSVDEVPGADGSRTWLISLLAQEAQLPNIGNWELLCTSQGQVVQTLPACPVADDSAYNAFLLDDPETPVLETDAGYFWRMERDQQAYEDGDYIHLFFLVRQPYGMAQEELPFSLQLADSSSGQILIEDVQTAFLRNLVGVLEGAFRADADSLVHTD